jgi:hypothetical protein
MNLGFTWTVIPTHKTCDGGVQKYLISLKRFHYTSKMWECGRLFQNVGLLNHFFLQYKCHKNVLPKKINVTNFFRNFDGCKVSGSHIAIS